MSGFRSVDDLLADARSHITRLTPVDAASATELGALLVDIRPEWQRAQIGEIPGAFVIERNHLEWRLHPESDARIPEAQRGQRWIIVCTEGYASSLAAASLESLGVPAADVDGGFIAWRDAGLPTSATVTPPGQRARLG